MYFRLLTTLTLAVSLFASTGQAVKYRYVTIDSGGMLGLIPAHLLADIEMKTEKPMHELVDGFGGTSTGAIIASLLAIPAPNSDLPVSASQVISFYQDKGTPIFSAALKAAIGNQLAKFGIGKMDFSAGALLEQYARAQLSDRKIRDAKTRLVILSHSLNMRKHVYFDSRKTELFAVDAIRASASITDIFGPKVIEIEGQKHRFVDAGSMGVPGALSDPTHMLIAKLEKELAENDECVIYSLGTGFMDGYAHNIKHPGIRVVRIEPDMTNFMNGQYEGELGKNLLAAQTSTAVTDAMMQVAETLKNSDGYRAMLADLISVKLARAENRTEL